MHQSEKKNEAALAEALNYVPDGALLGVGTGSTVNYFIDALPATSRGQDQRRLFPVRKPPPNG